MALFGAGVGVVVGAGLAMRRRGGYPLKSKKCYGEIPPPNFHRPPTPSRQKDLDIAPAIQKDIAPAIPRFQEGRARRFINPVPRVTVDFAFALVLVWSGL